MNINQLLQHELYLQRVATNLINKGLFKSLDDAVAAVRLILLDAETIQSPTKLNAVNRAIKQAIDEAMTPAWQQYTDELLELAVFDADFYAELSGLPVVPGAQQIDDFVQSALMSLSAGQVPKVGTWSDFVRENISGMSEQINNLVKAGYINGATVNQIARTVRQFGDGLSRQQADALARTGMQHYSQSARRAMVNDNLDIVNKEYPLVTFDNRTSKRCISINVQYPDGWPVNESPVGYPPYHFSCRTQIVYGLKGMGDPRKGIDRAATGSGPEYERGDTYKGKKDIGAFEIEQVPANMSFGAWLKMQDREFVIDSLGATRAKLFLDGKLPLDRLSDAYGRELTLAELRAKYADAFKLAGL
jgi:hypothetical protein